MKAANWVTGEKEIKPSLHDIVQMTWASIELAKKGDKQFLQVMRRIAREVSKHNGHVTIDDLRFIIEPHGLKPSHHNVWGAVFTKDEFERVDFQKSRWPSNKGRLISVWRWRGPRSNAPG